MASTSDGRSILERERTAASKKCTQCGMLAQKASERILCGICKRHTHLECIKRDYTYTDNVLKQLHKPAAQGQPYVYACCFCKPRIKNKDFPVLITENEKAIANVSANYDKKIAELNNKLLDATHRITAKNALLEDSERERKLLLEKPPNGTNALIAELNNKIKENNETLAKLQLDKDILSQEKEKHLAEITELRGANMTYQTEKSHKRPRGDIDDGNLHGFDPYEDIVHNMKEQIKVHIDPVLQSIKRLEEKQNTLDQRQSSSRQQINSNNFADEFQHFAQLLNRLDDKQTALQNAIQSLQNNSNTVANSRAPRSTSQQRPITVRIATNNSNIVRQQNRPLQIPMSYAEAISKSPIPPEAIRNVTIKVNEEEMETIAANIRKDNACAGIAFTAIKQKGKYNFTYKCTDAQSAAQVEKTLVDKYNGSIQVTCVAPPKNQVKITRIFTEETDPNEILAQIQEQNIWMRNIDVQIERMYTINTSKTSYTNVILNCDLKTHAQLIERGRIIFGFSECKIYEHVEILQCLKCQRYGHFARECSYATCCKNCALGHESKQCTLDTNKYKCHNCHISNTKNGTKYDVRHTSTDDRCPMRIERIDALKEILLQKN